MAYTLIKRAKKNVGDFLIWERAKELLEKHTKEHDFLVFEGWKALDNCLAEINETKAVIVCGEPVYQKGFYSHVYPLLKRITKITIPLLFPLG